MLNKENILKQINNGLDFYKFVIPELSENGNRCKNVKNPFYKDKKAGLSIFFNENQWFFNDFGNSIYSGDVFKFASFYYNSNNFNEILDKINKDLFLNLKKLSSKNSYNKIEKQLFHIKNNDKNEAISYLKKREITNSKLFYQTNAYKKYPSAVVFINHNKTGFERRFIATQKELEKLDLPKTMFSGVKTNSLYTAGYDKNKDKIFICEGAINALSFVEKKYSAIATFGANNLPSAKLLETYIKNKTVYLAGDGDDAGDDFNNNLCKIIIENNIKVKELYKMFFPFGDDANSLLLNDNDILNNNFLQIVDIEKEKSNLNKNSNNQSIVKNNKFIEKDILKFPIDIFPKDLQEIIISANNSLKFPIVFFASSILFSASISIGNRLKIKVKNGWYENALVYIAIVGRAGTNKSHPLSFALKPLFDIDKNFYKIYENDFDKYDTVKDLSKKELEKDDLEKMDMPKLRQTIVSDITPESLNEVHNNNKSGLGLYKDELTAWINEFNRYHKGGDQQFWLSNWSGKTIKVNRKNSKPIFIDNPFISVCGTIQTAILDELNKDNMAKNGFLHRILFVIPDDLEKEYFSDIEMPDNKIDKYQNIIKKIYSLRDEQDYEGIEYKAEVNYSYDAKIRFKKWFNYNTDLINDKKISDNIKSIYSKFDIYISRFALILQIIKWSCNEEDYKIISLDTIEKAIKLTEYFRQTALKFNKIISSKSDNLDKKEFAKFLKNKGNSYREIADILNIGKSTIGNWFK